MINKKIILSGVFFCILLSLNGIYFFVYFSLLDLSFSLLHFFYLVVTTLSFFLLINFLRWKSWQFACYLVLLCFYLSSLVNFAYFKVFYVFIDFSFNQTQQLDTSMASFLKDFIHLVPLELYILAGIVYLGSLINLIIFFLLGRKERENILFNSSALQLVSQTKNRSVKQILVIVTFFCLVNFVAFGSASYYYNNPRDTWWDIKSQLTDLGFYGYFYSQLYAQTQDEEYTDSDLQALQRVQNTYQQIKKYTAVEESSFALPHFDKPPNILMVQLESTASWAVENDPSPTPYLKQLMEENIVIENFHANSCETINAEFSSVCSFLPNSDEPINYSYIENDYYCLPEILKEKYGYSTNFFHANTADFWNRDLLNPKWGYENIYQVPYFKQKLDDIEFLKSTVRKLHSTKQPFFAYAVTYSAHSPHNQELMDYQLASNGVKVKPFAGNLDPWMVSSSEISEQEIREYFGFLKVADDGLKAMMTELKNLKMLENTIVLIYNDHRYYNFKGNDRLFRFNAYNRMPFVMILPQKIQATWHSLASHLDLAPTILNIIEQEDYSQPENFLGQSLFAKDYTPVVVNKCLGRVYFANSDVIVAGNTKSKSYGLTLAPPDMLEIQKQKWFGLVKSIVSQSDEVLFSNGLAGDEY